jgi:hypothetical protein
VFSLSAASHACSASALRQELNLRACAFAQHHDLPFEQSSGREPSVLFCAKDGSHGNFPAPSYRRIRANPAWSLRLTKPHTAWRRAWPRADWQWRELDCAVSSDALLMSVLCYPRLLASTQCAALLGIERNAPLVFGFEPRLTRVREQVDTTEIDASLGDLLIEAKLTETDFQNAPHARLARFTHLEEVFALDQLPRTTNGAYAGYQLIRGVLAAHAAGCRFCVVCDARRADLHAQWLAVIGAVRSHALRCRLMLLTWQELSAATPHPLQAWLREKYGILPSTLL